MVLGGVHFSENFQHFIIEGCINNFVNYLFRKVITLNLSVLNCAYLQNTAFYIELNYVF